MDLSLLTVGTVITFLLILIRVSGMMVSAPILSLASMPAYTKIGTAIGLSLLLFPLHMGAKEYVVPHDIFPFAAMAGQEFLIGLLIGFAAQLVLTGIQAAGEMISIQMGLSVATVLDPVSQTQNPLIGQFYNLMAILLFLSLNIHHALIAAVHRSFEWIPLGQPFSHLTGILTQRFITMGQEMLVLAITFALPVFGVLLVLDIALSFVAKVMPQMNIFVVGMPLKVMCGMALMIASLPFGIHFISDQYAILVQHILGLFKG